MPTFEELEGCSPELEPIWDYPDKPNVYGGIMRVAYPYEEFDPATRRTLLREYNAWPRRLCRWLARLWRWR